MSFNLPVFDNKLFCIVDKNCFKLASIISSYTYNKEYYTPFFGCNNAIIRNEDECEEGFNDSFFSDNILKELDINLSNALNMIGSCEYLILGGLNDKQKSYLTFLDRYNVIDIQCEKDAHIFLGSIVSKEGSFKCNEKSILYGLYQASKTNCYLEIDNSISDLIPPLDIGNGLIVIEKINTVSTVTAINYALSIDAIVAIIPPVRIDGIQAISLIEKWKSNPSNVTNELKAEVFNSIEHIDFSKYEFATFFTVGVPYAVVLENIIPISHVHLYLNADFFVFNNIYYESNITPESGIVFSPLKFIDEETNFLIEELKKNQYYVKTLIGEDATAYNLDLHIKVYPFNILHICSHGGEINGYEINETFEDRDGNIHSVKYDQVVTFAPSPKKKLIPVTFKSIIRELDGFDWNNDKTEKEKYPSYVFEDMFNAISKNKKPNRKPVDVIIDSCSIKCFDFNYQAMFNIIASLTSPIIFNNTCWSWYEIALSFISSGARGYIGTLWDINNKTAIQCAEIFYKSLFKDTVLNSLHKSLKEIIETKDEHVYIYWGLHFTTLSIGKSVKESRLEIASRLLQSLERWKLKLAIVKDSNKKNINEIIEWNASQLAREFNSETLREVL